MAGPFDLTGQNIENTYQRVLQTPDGATFYDGTGSLVTLPSANTASLLITASATLNNIQFTKGDGSTFNVTVDTGSGGTVNTSGFVTTSSFNAFTSSINNFTSSYNTGSFSGSFTGSLNGTATNNLITASATLNVIQFTKGDGSTFNVTINTGSGGTTAVTGSNITQSFSNTATWTFTHNLGTRVPIITVFDTNYKQIIPQDIELVNTNSATITFPTAESGFAIASLGGVANTALSASYASTASYYAETDPVFVAKSASLATTGSNIFRGNQTVTGSLFTIGSNTLIGSTTLTGSLNISGSTTQTGNNTLIGTTTLTGSINISGDIIPTASSSFDLGSETNPWRSLYVQSGSISIQSDIPGGVPAVISNANGDVTIAGAGFQIKSGSAVPFNITPAGLITINTPKTLLTTETAVSIIGSTTGYQQSRNFTGTLLQLTAQDNQPGRISIDSFGTGTYGLLAGRTARGTVNSPSQSKAGDTLFRISAQGWSNSNSFIGSIVRVDWEAAEDFTSTSAGTRLRLQTTPTGSTTIQTSAIIDTTGITIPSTSKFFGTASWAENALTASFLPVGTYNITSSWAISASQAVSASFATTASFALNVGGGSNINTGSFATTGSNRFNGNQTITGSLLVSGSTTHTGSLTLSSGSVLAINDGFYVNGNKQFNYGQFSSTQTQTGLADTAYSATFDTTHFSQGVSLVAGSRITVSNTGIYNIQFSSQLHTTQNNQAVDFSIWFAMTGSNIANSNTYFTIERTVGGGFQVAALNFLTQIASGSYIELKYSKTTAQGQLYAIGTQSSPTRPATPSVILTVTQVA